MNDRTNDRTTALRWPLPPRPSVAPGDPAILARLDRLETAHRLLAWQQDLLRLQLGQLLVEAQRHAGPIRNLQDAGFTVFSQWDDDGIINYLLDRLPQVAPVCIEIGTGDWHESNTRFLVQYRNWQGVLIDRDAEALARLRQSELLWRHDLEVITAHVTVETINSLVRQGLSALEGIAAGADDAVGLLSIDVDGMDYWLWDALEVVRPALVICEYNAVFGAQWAVTVPYDPAFDRYRAHPSGLYFGASLAALHHLAARKGYVWIGCNRAGNNAYFVEQRHAPAVADLARSARFQPSRFRESQAADGSGNSYIGGRQRARLIAACEVWNVDLGRHMPLGELLDDDDEERP